MCDALSWGILRRDIPEINMKRGQRIGPLTDEEIIAKWGTGANFEDRCGHAALAEYYGIPMYAFAHREGHNRIPRPIVKDANAGKFRQCFRASLEFLSVRYRHDGTLAETTMKKPHNMRTLSEVRDDPELYAKFLEEVRKVPVPLEEEGTLKLALQHFDDRQSDFIPDGGFGPYSNRGINEFVTCTLTWDRYNRSICASLHHRMYDALQDAESLGGTDDLITLKYDQRGLLI